MHSPLSPAAKPAHKPPVVVRATWTGERRFDVGRPGPGGGPTAHIDASSTTALSPVETLVAALATCATVDVIDILAKHRTPVERLAITVTGERAQAIPARLTRATLEFQVEGKGIDRANAERAVDLSLTKYCSVRSSLDPAIPIGFSVTLNGEAGATRLTSTP